MRREVWTFITERSERYHIRAIGTKRQSQRIPWLPVSFEMLFASKPTKQSNE